MLSVRLSFLPDLFSKNASLLFERLHKSIARIFLSKKPFKCESFEEIEKVLKTF